MNIKIVGKSKEIADFVLRIQSQPKITSDKASKAFASNFIQVFATTRDNGEECCGQHIGGKINENCNN